MKTIAPILKASVTFTLFSTALLTPSPAKADLCADHHARGEYNILRGSANYHPENDRDNDGVACESGSRYAGTDHSANTRNTPLYSILSVPSALRDIGTHNAIGRTVCPKQFGVYPVMATRITTTYRWGEQIGNLVMCGTVLERDLTATHVDIVADNGWQFRVDATALILRW